MASFLLHMPRAGAGFGSHVRIPIKGSARLFLESSSPYRRSDSRAETLTGFRATASGTSRMNSDSLAGSGGLTGQTKLTQRRNITICEHPERAWEI